MPNAAREMCAASAYSCKVIPLFFFAILAVPVPLSFFCFREILGIVYMRYTEMGFRTEAETRWLPLEVEMFGILNYIISGCEIKDPKVARKYYRS